MFRKLFIALSLVFSACLVHAQTTISASDVSDSFDHPIAAAKLCFAPVDATGTATGFRSGSTQVVSTPVCGLVSNGVLQSGLTVVPTPSGVYYHITVNNRTSNAVIRDYGMTQITGGSWTLDTYDPSMAVLPVSALTMGTVTPLSPGSDPSCNITGGSPALLNCAIPSGEPGAAGAAGATGATGAAGAPYTGVTTNLQGNGLNIAGNIAEGFTQMLTNEPVAYCTALQGSNSLYCTNAVGWSTGQGLWVPEPRICNSSGCGEVPLTPYICDHVTVSGNTLTAFNADNSACDSPFTEGDTPVLHYQTDKCSITSGHNTCTLSDGSTWVNGQGARIAGAGTSGADLICAQTTISGTTLTCLDSSSAAQNAGTTITNALVFHDDSYALSTALAASLSIHLAPGQYWNSQSQSLTNAGQTFQGSGTSNTWIVTTQDAIKAWVIKGDNDKFADLTIAQSDGFVATSGAGLDVGYTTATITHPTNYPIVSNVQIYKHWNGRETVGYTTGAFITGTISEYAVNYGAYVNNTTGGGDTHEVSNELVACGQWCMYIYTSDTAGYTDMKLNGGPQLLFVGNPGGTGHQRFSGGSWEGCANYGFPEVGPCIIDQAGSSFTGVDVDGGAGDFYSLTGASEITGGRIFQGSGGRAIVVNAGSVPATTISGVDIENPTVEDSIYIATGAAADISGNSFSNSSGGYAIDCQTANGTWTIVGNNYYDSGWGVYYTIAPNCFSLGATIFDAPGAYSGVGGFNASAFYPKSLALTGNQYTSNHTLTTSDGTLDMYGSGLVLTLPNLGANSGPYFIDAEINPITIALASGAGSVGIPSALAGNAALCIFNIGSYWLPCSSPPVAPASLSLSSNQQTGNYTLSATDGFVEFYATNPTLTLPVLTASSGPYFILNRITTLSLAFARGASGALGVPSTLAAGQAICLSGINISGTTYWGPCSAVPPLIGTTGTITGTALSASCDSGTATVTGAAVGNPVSVSSTTGADVGAAFDLRASVTSSNTVTVYVCGTGTPSSLAYNVAVHP